MCVCSYGSIEGWQNGRLQGIKPENVQCETEPLALALGVFHAMTAMIEIQSRQEGGSEKPLWTH